MLFPMTAARCTAAVFLVATLVATGFSQENDKESPSSTDAENKLREVSVAKGNVRFRVPAAWKSKQPRVNLIEREFEIAPPKDSDLAPGRLTVMAAMGSVEQNIARWQGQFEQPDGKPTKDRTKIKEIKVDKQTVKYVDISGTYQDRRGPFAPAVSRENYRMLAAILPTEKHGQYFLKLYGPQQTIAHSEKEFQEMIESFQVND